MSVDPEWLKEIIENDETGLLTLPTKVAPTTSHDRLVTGFNEICAFIETHGRPPEPTPSDMAEFKLYHRLHAILDDPEQRAELAEYDRHGILVEPEPPATLDEIFASDDLGVLDESPAVAIFTLKHVPAEKSSPDEVAERQPCPDFEQFAPLFKQCHADLKAGTRQMIEFRNESQISAESFYVVRGVLAYVADIGEEAKVRGRRVARLRCIFENGTESNLLLASLARSLYDNGRRVTEPAAVTLARMGLEVETTMGVIYVLRSLSAEPQVTSIPNLHKIGFTNTTTAKRVVNAAHAKTYLNAPVKIVAEYGVPAAIASGVEMAIHHFFAAARLNVTYERDGESITSADEWFSVPLQVIDEAISLLEAETITNYEYDPLTETIRIRQT